MNEQLKTGIKVIAIVSVAVLLIIAVAAAATNRQDITEFEQVEYRVQDGDTLWSIGRRCVGDTVDIREWITITSKDNHLGKYIYPGDIITVYVAPGYSPY